MKNPSVLHLGLLLIALTASLRAAAPHATVLTVKYKDAMLPVVKVIGTDPVVLVEGKERRIRTEPIYQPQRSRDFSPAEVTLKDVSLGGIQIHPAYDQADIGEKPPMIGNHGGIAEFKASLVAKQPLEGAFIAVVLYSEALFVIDSDLFHTQIVVHALPPLPAGVAVPVRITSKMFTFIPGQKYFVQVFDREGVEIYTPYAQPGWAYYALLEKLQLAAVLKPYLAAHAGKNAPAKPVVVIKPLLPPGTARPEGPITAYLTVTPEGLVEDIALSDTLPRGVESAVRAALSGWLFLPRLKAGSTVSSRIEVPLQF